MGRRIRILPPFIEINTITNLIGNASSSESGTGCLHRADGSIRPDLGARQPARSGGAGPEINRHRPHSTLHTVASLNLLNSSMATAFRNSPFANLRIHLNGSHAPTSPSKTCRSLTGTVFNIFGGKGESHDPEHPTVVT